MQQERGKTEPYQREQPASPLQCPRCGSPHTKFRYYNNNDKAQPRYYCKSCRRYWTVGGSLREVPIGGSRRQGNQRKDVSPTYSNSTSTLLPSSSIFEEEWGHRSQYRTPMAAAVIPQNFDTATFQPFRNLAAPISPPNLYHFNENISSLAAMQFLNNPQIINEPFSTGNQSGNSNVEMETMQECNFHPMALQQTSLQQIPSHGDNLVLHPSWPVNSFPHDFNNNFTFSESNATFWNSNGNINDQETASTSINLNNWPDFPN